MQRRALISIAIGLLAAGCGRTGLGPFDDEVADGGLDGGDDRGSPPGGVGGSREPDDPYDPEIPEPPASCGNGIVEPGELCYLPEITFPSRIDPCAIDIGDFDDDGHLDAIVPNSDFNHLESLDNITSVLYGNGLGGLSDPFPYLTGDDIPVGVRVGDLDNNGQLDAVITNSDAGTATVLINFGSRELVDLGRITAGAGPVVPDIGDLNGDGIPDVAISASDEVRVALGRGDGTFEASVSYPQPGYLWDVRLLDIDHDGALDMLASDAGTPQIYVWLGDGAGRLVDSDSIELDGLPLGISDTDINGSGNLDLLVAHSNGMTVLVGDGAGGFIMRSRIEAGIEPRAVALGDMDSDGRLDAAILNSGSEDITITLGHGDGDFEYATTYGVGTLPSGIRAGDFNSDGVPDLIVSNQLSNNVGLILSNP